MTYHDDLDEVFLLMACKSVNWENPESPSNHAMQVARDMRKIFNERAAPVIDRHLAASAEIITEQYDALNAERQQIAHAWEALDLAGNPGRDSLMVVIEARLQEIASLKRQTPEERQERPWSPMVIGIIRNADHIAKKRGTEYVDTCHLLLGLIESNESYAMQAMIEVGHEQVQTIKERAEYFCDGFEGKGKDGQESPGPRESES